MDESLPYFFQYLSLTWHVFAHNVPGLGVEGGVF